MTRMLWPVLAITFALPAYGQSTGGQNSPATNQATPLQQMPTGTNPSSAARQLSDRDFALAMASANRFEILEGELALAQASDPKLKEFAQLMIKDHNAALDELRAAAKSTRIDLPAEIALDEAHQAKLNAMQNRRGGDFDQAYRTDQVQAHEKAIALLDTYAQAGGNAALKTWAAKTLPVVRKHRQHLQSLGMGASSG